MHEHLSCQQLVDLLVDYLENDLEGGVRRLLETHLSDCPKCEKFLAEYQRTSLVCRQELARRMPPELQQRLMRVLREQLVHENDEP